MGVDRIRLAAFAALAAGVALLAYAAIEGSLRVGFFLIVPFVYGTGGAAALGMLLLMAAAVLGFASMARGEPGGGTVTRAPDAPEATTTRHGGVVLLGPIPIVWGNARLLPWTIALGAALLVLALLVSWARR